MIRILLVSGGYDSTLLYQQKKGIIDRFIYFDYGQKAMKMELKTLGELGVPYEVINLGLLLNKNGFYYGRNLKFFIKLMDSFPDEDLVVYFGNCADDNYPDNSREYLYRIEKLINDSYPKTLRIICPLENMSKKEITKSVSKAYYCDRGGEQPCGECHSCQAV